MNKKQNKIPVGVLRLVLDRQISIKSFDCGTGTMLLKLY